MKMKKNILGVDIGGTKCAVIYGQKEGDTLHLVEKVKFPTTSVDETIANICSEIEQMMGRHGLDPSNTGAIGISCGGPLDSKRGVVMSPPEPARVERYSDRPDARRTFRDQDGNP